MAHEILALNSVHPTQGYSHAAKVGNLGGIGSVKNSLRTAR